MFKTVYEENEQQNTVLGLHETDSGLFREPGDRIPWDTALKGKGGQESWQRSLRTTSSNHTVPPDTQDNK